MRRRDFLRNTALTGLVVSSGGVSLPIGLSGPAFGQGMAKEKYVTAGGIFLLSAYSFVGIETGSFREFGVDIELQSGAGTAASLTQVASGTAGFGQAAPITSCPAIADQKAELISIAQASYPGYFEIASLPGKPLKDPAELKGKTIGIMSQGGSTELLLDAVARAKGVDPASVNRVVTGISTSGIAFMERGQIDGFFVFYETKVALDLQGVKMNYLAIDDYVTLPGDALITSSKVVGDAAREDLVVRYLKGVRKAMDFVRNPANEEKVLDMFVKYNSVQGSDRPRSKATLDVVRRLTTPPVGTPSLRLHEDSWHKGLTLLEDIGAIKTKGLPRDKYFTNKYIDLALKA